MKSIIILALISSLFSCKAQTEIDSLKSQLAEFENKVIEIYNEKILLESQNNILEDSIDHYKNMADHWKLSYEMVSPYSDSVYNVFVESTERIDSVNYSYSYKQDDGNVWFERWDGSDVIRFQIIEGRAEFWYGKDIENNTWMGNKIFDLPINWIKK